MGVADVSDSESNDPVGHGLKRQGGIGDDLILETAHHLKY